MTSKNLRQLPAASDLQGPELIYGVQQGNPVKLTVENLVQLGEDKAQEAAGYAAQALASEIAAESSEANALTYKNAAAASQATTLANKNAAAASEANALTHKNAADSSAAAAASSALDALNSKTAAEASALSAALQVTATADQATVVKSFAQTAVAQAALTASYSAASAPTVQDLSGTVAATLHRSPNSVVATCFMDISKDSDPTWMDRLADGTSWGRESLNGMWLGWHASEMDARDYFGSLGAASIVTGDSSTFTNGVGAWGNVSTATTAAVSGRLRLTLTGSGTGGYTSVAVPTVIGQRYRVEMTKATVAVGGKNIFIHVSNTPGGSELANFNTGSAAGVAETSFTATATTTYVKLLASTTHAAGDVIEIDDFTVTPVDLSRNPSGAYYGLSTDGKCYRLWKNLLKNSTSFVGPGGTTGWAFTNVSGTATNSGNAFTFGANSTDRIIQSGIVLSIPTGVPLSGSVTFAAGSSGTVRVGVFNGGGSLKGAQEIVLTGSEQTIKVENFSNDFAGVNCGIGVYNNASGTAGASFTLLKAQFEVGGTVTADEVKGADASQTETFRGNKQKLKQGVAIAEASRVVIYDVLEPSCPMWMVFVGATTANWWGSSTAISCLAYKEGKLAVGGSSTGLRIIDFAADKFAAGNGSAAIGVPQGNIAGRNSTPVWLGPMTYVLANTAVNAVAMTTLPDAPVDPVTGLQVPTIAVATAGGASVLRDDGSVVSSSSGQVHHKVWFARGRLYTTYLGHQVETARVRDLTAGFSYSTQGPLIHGDLGVSWGGGGGIHVPNPLTPLVITGSAAIGITDNVVAHSKGVALLRRGHNPSTTLTGAITPTYATGWMVGDIRRALLADVGAGVVGGTEYVSNGTFSTDTAGWAPNQATLAAVSGQLEVTATAAGFGQANQSPVPALTVGQWYRVRGTCRNSTGTSVQIAWWDGSVQTNIATDSAGVEASVDTLVQVKAPGAFLKLNVTSTAAGQKGYFDNISITDAAPDRSYKAKPSNIVGSLVKTAVAAAAQMVFWSGFSATNYLQEAYSADLDPGTGALAVGVWGSLPVLTGKYTANPGNWPAVSAELISNGTFDAGTTGWAGIQGTMTNPDGHLRIQETGAAEGQLRTTVNVVTGRWYKVEFDRIGNTGGVGSVILASTKINSTSVGEGRKTVFIKSPSTGAQSLSIGTDNGTGTGAIEIDNVSCVEIGPAWAIDRSGPNGAYYRVGCWPDGTLVAELSDGTTTRTVTSTVAYNTAQAFSALVCYETTGTLSMCVNGERVVQMTGTALASITNTNALLTIGNNRTLNAAWPGSLAMVKIGMTTPTEDAVRWIYAQERSMFQPGAQITLPDANSIVDMDFDSDLGLLCGVGTGYEWSFRGLIRSSATPVGTGAAFSKVFQRNGYKLIVRGTSVDITIPAISLKEELSNASAAVTSETKIFDFDATAGQIDFSLPLGWSALDVLNAGVLKREGSTKDWIRLYNGFREIVRFAVAPGAAAWIQIAAKKVM